MGLILVKKTIIVLFLISSTSIPGLRSTSPESKEVSSYPQQKSWEPHSHYQKTKDIDDAHKRLLLDVNTKDYGSYDPAPAFVKPPFKLIPN
ncbi:protein CASPARIAN STRIP INTEGRITY FACTOR 2-like [Henckelia pumila]|uniref:protein CASPARIAN STRIP INTEGRITY FACTOR 2-like n=1 Tax=Henckelia pumila TaxID=405737 RepID=UPI003C6DF263